MKLKIKIFVFFVLIHNLLFAQTGEEVSKSWFNGITSQLIIVTILISLIFSFVTLLLGSKLFKDSDGEVSNNIKKYVKRKIDDANWSKSTSNEKISKADLHDVYIRITDLEKQIEQIKKQLNTSNPVVSYSKHATQQNIKEAYHSEVKTETFFLSTPNADGSFNDSSVQQIYKDGATIYRFVKIGTNKARFQIDENDSSIKLALQYPNKNIDPVCDAENEYETKYTKIKFVDLGDVELQNGKWVIITKAKIRYEN